MRWSEHEDAKHGHAWRARWNGARGQSDPERRSEIAREAAAARWRPRIAHQRVIREQTAVREPREILPSLDGCTVGPVTREQARPIILRYEWLGTMGHAKAWYRLRAPDGELLGVVGFGHNSGGDASRNLCGPEARALVVCLERGACVHYAPRNAASYLIRRAVRLAHRDHGWTIFYAYADPDAGEIGTIYQALGWSYIGQGADRAGRKRDQFIRPDGRRVGERMLRHGGVKMGDVLGWRRVQTLPKHRYVHFEDAALRARCRFEFQPYPKRHVLKRKCL